MIAAGRSYQQSAKYGSKLLIQGTRPDKNDFKRDRYISANEPL